MISPRRVVQVPARAAYEVTRCYDCPHFKEYGAPYQDGNVCIEDDLNDIRTVDGNDMPDWCPKAEEVPDEPAG